MTEGKGNRRRTLLSSMEEVVDKAKYFSLKDRFYEEVKDSLAYISKKLKITSDEAILLSLFFERSSQWRIRISDIADMINTTNIRIIGMMNIADGLVSKHYIKKLSDRDEVCYNVPMEVIDCIRNNAPFTPKPITGLTFEDLFERLEKIYLDNYEKMDDMLEKINDLINGNPQLNYCKVASMYAREMDPCEKIVFHFFAHRLINEDDDMIGNHEWEEYVGSKRHARTLVKRIKSCTSALTMNGLIEAKINDGMKDASFYHLSDKAKEELFPDLDLVETQTQKGKELTPYTSFAEKEMFYSPGVKSQIDRLTGLLQPEYFSQIVKRLDENGMRKGFACLFYGSPGTGKTETVNQLARMTGRDVMLVDVTQIKSCWVGESEKHIKELFDRYRYLVKSMEVAPILLFNEADGVLGIRQEGAQRAVDKMENSLQNIILQEMESLEGIMIATTNLTSNLDKAFERRFIYKIEFERPTVDAKRQIWKSMIPSLSDETALSLASEFDLSGGQIENIARKRTVELILSGQEPSEEKLREYCLSETINSQYGKVGKIGF
jgi:hypothetical protein